jgi:hypothetical protein
VRLLAAAVMAAGVTAVVPSNASALLTQCPPAGVNSGCQYLITLTDFEQSVERDFS